MSFIDTAGLSRFAGKIKDNFATNSAVNAIGTRVSSLETTVAAHVVNIGDMSTKIATMSGNIATMSSNIATVSGIATSNSSNITSLNNSIVAIESNYPSTLHFNTIRSGDTATISFPNSCAGIIKCSGTVPGLRDIFWFGVNNQGAVSYTKESEVIKEAATAAAGATIEIGLGSNIGLSTSLNTISLSNSKSGYQMTVITEYATAN